MDDNAMSLTPAEASTDHKMDDAVGDGVAAAQGKTGEELSERRKEEWKKRYREQKHNEQERAQRLKTVREDGSVTDASLRSSATFVTDNKHHSSVSDGDKQQLAYRDSIEEGSVASFGDGSHYTWKSSASLLSHQNQLAERRLKDRETYVSMSKDERRDYNAKRRDKYHRQSQESRQKHRERQRNKYHHGQKDSVASEAESQQRQARRMKLAQERLRSGPAAYVASSSSD